MGRAFYFFWSVSGVSQLRRLELSIHHLKLQIFLHPQVISNVLDLNLSLPISVVIS